MSNDTFVAKLRDVWGKLVVYKNGKVATYKLRKGKFKLWFKKFRKSDDVRDVVGAIFTMLMDGIVISGLLYYWIGFDWRLLIAFGAGWFFLKSQGFKEFRQLLASLSLVRIGK